VKGKVVIPTATRNSGHSDRPTPRLQSVNSQGHITALYRVLFWSPHDALVRASLELEDLYRIFRRHIFNYNN